MLQNNYITFRILCKIFKMLTIKDTKTVNLKIAQWKLALANNLLKKIHNTAFIFNKISSLNCRVVATNYLKLHFAEWIGSTPLHFALKNEDLAAIDILLSHGADFTLKNSSGSTALLQLIEDKSNLLLKASASDDFFVHLVISAHIKYGIFENPVNSNGLSHFHIACAINHVEVVKGFLRSEVVVDHAVKADSSIFPRFTPLHFAAKYCASEVLEVLLSHGAITCVKDAKGLTALHLALEQKLSIVKGENLDELVRDSNERILKMLLEKDYNDKVMINNDLGLSGTHIACALDDSKTAERCVKKAVDINRVVNMDSPLWPGYTALHFAALCNMDTVKLLLKSGADMRIKDAKGITAFDICIERYQAKDIHVILALHPVWKNTILSNGKTKLTDLVLAMTNSKQFGTFLKKIGKNSHLPDSSLWPSYTPMHLAVTFSKKCSNSINKEASEDVNLQILKKLFKHNPGMLHNQDIHGRTPLHLAFYSDKEPALQLLLKLIDSRPKLLVDKIDKNGLSYLHIASAKKETKLLERLLAMGTNVNANYKGKLLVSPTIFPGSTALHLAVVNENIEALKALIKHGADVYAKDENDMTAVHLILLNRNEELCDILLSLPDLKDSVVSKIGLGHLHVACLCENSAYAETLLNNGADINAVITPGGFHEFRFLEMYEGHSPLLLAYEYLKYHSVRLLLERDADIFVQNTQGDPLTYRIMEMRYNPLLEPFFEVLKKKADLQSRLKSDTGMTDMHIACSTCDCTEIGKLLCEGANVNARLRSDSPIFQGYTPLHIIMHIGDRYVDGITDQAIKLLVEAGADVTLQNEKLETVVHMAWKLFYQDCLEYAKPSYNRLNILLEAHRDFSVNPANIGGISHFHVACHVCNTSAIRKFLSIGAVDINQPIDSFYVDLPGYTALHLTALAGNQTLISDTLRFCDATRQLQAIDLLLNHGADVRAEDDHGYTPLHECSRFGSLDIFERLVRGGADVDARNLFGNTPMYYFMRVNGVSIKDLKVLLRFGCHLNVFSAITGGGYVGNILDIFPYDDVQNFLATLSINFKQEMEADNLGRTIIHNIVSTNPSRISANEYATLIGQISGNECDVDGQDDLGMTALHMAAKFNNYKGISGLLTNGADINLTDISGKMAFANCNFNACRECEALADSTNVRDGQDYEDDHMCQPLRSIITLALHIKKLQLCGLDVFKQNEEFACKAFDKIKNKTVLSEGLFQELESTKNTRISTHSFTLYDFLSENGVVADYPTMSEIKRNDINKFFSSDKVSSLREQFPHAAGVLKLQYRKAIARPQLVESAKDAMEFLMGFACRNFVRKKFWCC